MYKILLADADLYPLIEEYFSSYSVDIALSAEDMYSLTFKNKYDLYIVNFYYFDTLKELQESGDTTSILFIDEYYNIYNLKNSLSIGDDYLVKPINAEELKIRVAYHYRKMYKHNRNTLIYKELFFHIKTKQLFKKNSKLKLSPNEAKLIELFLLNINKPICKDEIFEFLESDSDGTLRVYISKLNKMGFTFNYERANSSYTLNL